jgi:hypothetical protein
VSKACTMCGGGGCEHCFNTGDDPEDLARVPSGQPDDAIRIGPWTRSTPTATLPAGFRATRYVPLEWKGAPNVMGGGVSGEYPTFIEGYGPTPSAALTCLERNLGEAYIHVCALEKVS